MRPSPPRQATVAVILVVAVGLLLTARFWSAAVTTDPPLPPAILPVDVRPPVQDVKCPEIDVAAYQRAPEAKHPQFPRLQGAHPFHRVSIT